MTKEENSTIILIQELGNQLEKIFPEQGFVLITYDQFTDKVLSFVSNDTQNLPYVFDQINDKLGRIKPKDLFISKRIGNT